MPEHPPLQVAYNQPILVGNETESMAQTGAAAMFSGDGLFTHKASELLVQQPGVLKVLLTSSDRHALEMCALLLGIQPDDEAILSYIPPYGGQFGDCPMTERVSDQLVRLTFHTALIEADLAKVVKAIREYDY